MRKVTVAAVQMRCTENVEENIARAEALVRKAAAEGAQIILLPELFERPYFCQERRYEYYEYAQTAEENPAVPYILPFPGTTDPSRFQLQWFQIWYQKP